MAGVEKIKEKILQDAESKVNEILEKARLQAKEIVENGKQKAAQKGREISQKALHDANEKKRIINSIVELEMRKDILAAKQEVIDNVFETALQNLSQMPAAKYFELLSEMILSSVKTGNEEIILSEFDRQRSPEGFLDQTNALTAEIGMTGALIMSRENRNIRGGFVLVSDTMEINQTFEAIIKMKREELEAEVVSLLFSPESR
jgi:V/A-type H+-transporting ATPase subunit E